MLLSWPLDQCLTFETLCFCCVDKNEKCVKHKAKGELNASSHVDPSQNASKSIEATEHSEGGN